MLFCLETVVEIQSKGPLSAVKICLKCIGAGHPLCHSDTKGRGQSSTDMQGEDNEKRGGRRQGASANAWRDHDTGSNSQSGGTLGIHGKGEEWLYRHDTCLVDTNKGDNYLIISLC